MVQLQLAFSAEAANSTALTASVESLPLTAVEPPTTPLEEDSLPEDSLRPKFSRPSASCSRRSNKQPLPSNLEPERQQPYRLQILRILGAVTDDPDMALLHFMEHGVPRGATSPIPTSHQWPPATEQSELEASTLLDLCFGKWKAATDHPTEVAALIQKEIDNGWVIEAKMSVAEALALRYSRRQA